MWNKLRNLFTRKQKPTDLELALIDSIQNQSKTIERLFSHVIALARLGFIDTKRLVEEANNAKSNAEYILKMTEVQHGNTDVHPKSTLPTKHKKV